MHNYVDATDEAARRSEPEATDWRLLPHGDELAEFLHVYIPRVKAHTIYCDPHCYVVRLEHEYSMPYGCADCNLIQQFVDNLSSNVWIGVCESPKGHLRDGPLGADGWWGSVRVGVGVGVSVSVSLGAALGAALLARCRALWCSLGALGALGALRRSRALSGRSRRSQALWGWLGRSRSVSDTIRRSETLWAGQGIRGGSEGDQREQSRAECRGSEHGEGNQRGAEGREAASPPHTPKPNRCSPTDTPTDTESQRSESPANFSSKDPPTG